MAHAYTPGLRVAKYTRILKERRLPLLGDVLAKVGDKVNADDVVARTELPGNVASINVANKLGIEPEDVETVMIKKAGDAVERGEKIAQNGVRVGRAVVD